MHADRIKLVGKSERLLAAGERGRYTTLINRNRDRRNIRSDLLIFNLSSG